MIRKALNMCRRLLPAVLLLGPLAVSGLFETPAAFAEPRASPAQGVDLEVFVREGCSHCAKAKEFLEELKREKPDLAVVLHEISLEPQALEKLRALAEKERVSARVPAFVVNGQLIVGFLDAATTGQLIREALAASGRRATSTGEASGSCEAEESLSCEGAPATAVATAQPGVFEIGFLGRKLSVEEVGLPLFTLAMGLLDGFNPCSMWVLILMISLLAPMRDRLRMLAIAGTFVAVEGAAYFVFMAAWLNLFLLIGLSRASEIVIAAIAILAGGINLKDFWAYGWGGVSLSIPDAAKPGIYARMRRILHAENLWGAMIGAVVLAVLVQIVEFLCTSGFPALYTRILTLRQLDGIEYYAYLLLYNLAYMLDDVLVLGIGVITLSQRRLQEKEGRWLKLISGLVMVALGLYLLVSPRG